MCGRPGADCLADYDRSRFLADLDAGLVVGMVALSLCIGLGIASRVTPAAGLYSGLVGGFIVSALGGSRVQIGGPAGAFVGLVALTAANCGLPNLLLCKLLAWWPRTWQRRLPGSIVVVVLGTVAVALFDLEVATIGLRFGGIPQGLPRISILGFDWHWTMGHFPDFAALASPRRCPGWQKHSRAGRSQPVKSGASNPPSPSCRYW